MDQTKPEFGKTKYDLAIKIADDLNLKTVCLHEAGADFLERTPNIQEIDKALELYLERIKKILHAVTYG